MNGVIKCFNNSNKRIFLSINNNLLKRSFMTSLNGNNIKWDNSWSVKELLLKNDNNNNNNNNDGEGLCVMSEDRIKQLSRLAMISIPDDKIQQYCEDIGGFLKAVESIQCVNTDNIKPLHSILEENPLELHKENTSENNDHEHILKHSQFTQGGFYTVPKQISSASHGKNKIPVYQNDDEF